MRPGMNGKKPAVYLMVLLALVLGIILFIVQSGKNRGNEMPKPLSQAPAAEGAEEKKEEERKVETAPAPEEEEAPEDREVLTGVEIEIPLEETAGTGQNAGYTGAGQHSQQPEKQNGHPSQTGPQGGSPAREESRPSREGDGGNVSGQDTEMPPVSLETEPADTPSQGDNTSGQPSDPPENTESQEESGSRDDPSGGGGPSSGTGYQGDIELPEIP